MSIKSFQTNKIYSFRVTNCIWTRGKAIKNGLNRNQQHAKLRLLILYQLFSMYLALKSQIRKSRLLLEDGQRTVYGTEPVTKKHNAFYHSSAETLHFFKHFRWLLVLVLEHLQWRAEIWVHLWVLLLPHQLVSQISGL